ncbi:MAG TPA: hypothetical protein VHM72_03985 [Solirubrobacteraceae bacterium]|jgi:hypothetical protein|nr:hypothetical protein [Solirubrobacteraceae bacterium]
MGLVIAATFGFALWIVLWALGISGLDAFLLALLVMLLGAAGRVVIGHLPGHDASGSQP